MPRVRVKAVSAVPQWARHSTSTGGRGCLAWRRMPSPRPSQCLPSSRLFRFGQRAEVVSAGPELHLQSLPAALWSRPPATRQIVYEPSLALSHTHTRCTLWHLEFVPNFVRVLLQTGCVAERSCCFHALVFFWASWTNTSPGTEEKKEKRASAIEHSRSLSLAGVAGPLYNTPAAVTACVFVRNEYLLEEGHWFALELPCFPSRLNGSTLSRLSSLWKVKVLGVWVD